MLRKQWKWWMAEFNHICYNFASQNLGLMRRMSENLVIAQAREQAVSLSEFFWCAQFGNSLTGAKLWCYFGCTKVWYLPGSLKYFSVVPLSFCRAMIRPSSTQLRCTIFCDTYLVWIGIVAIISGGVVIIFIFIFINIKSSSLSLLLHSMDFLHLLLEACDSWFHCLIIPFFFLQS